VKASNRKQKSRSAVSTVAKAVSADVFPIVGVGASAGGLEAFSELLRGLPAKTGMAFVLVQHLDPKHSSELRQILSRTTALPVAEVTDGPHRERAGSHPGSGPEFAGDQCKQSLLPPV
jgi:two-component system CheB/CheR fusion protein